VSPKWSTNRYGRENVAASYPLSLSLSLFLLTQTFNA
jgi:hypothetical protein